MKLEENLAEYVAFTYEPYIGQEVRSYIQIASDNMKSRYYIREGEALYVEGNRVWYYESQGKRGQFFKLQKP